MSLATAARAGARAPRLHRSLYTTPCRANKIGPPHPISNLRPVIYSDAPPSTQRAMHPYSLHEFDEDPTRLRTNYDLQWKFARQDLDSFNHNFWLDVRDRVVCGEGGCSCRFTEQFAVRGCTTADTRRSTRGRTNTGQGGCAIRVLSALGVTGRRASRRLYRRMAGEELGCDQVGVEGEMATVQAKVDVISALSLKSRIFRVLRISSYFSSAAHLRQVSPQFGYMASTHLKRK